MAVLSATVAAQGPYAEAPAASPPVTLTVGHTPASPWRVAVSAQENAVSVTHAKYPRISFLVDADGPEDDHHYEGITPVLDGRSFEGTLYREKVSLFSPDHDAGRTERVLVEALDTLLRVRFEGGSYRNLSAAGGPDPAFFEAVFSIDKDERLNANLNGLYYLFPAALGTRVFVRTRTGETSREFGPGTPKGYEYFEEVLHLEIELPNAGNFTLDGLVQRMQLHAHGGKNTDVFEIDLDHSFKDRGQREVLLRFRLNNPIGPKASANSVPETRGSPPRWECRALRNPANSRRSCERAEKVAPRSAWPARSAPGPQLPRRILFRRLLGYFKWKKAVTAQRSTPLATGAVAPSFPVVCSSST